MADKTGIEWTEATWNPWHGCMKISPGCANCYMYREKIQYGQDPKAIVRSKTKFNDPLKWKEPKMVFTCSWSDFFIEQADQWRDDAWDVIRRTPQHTYQILTKRPERIKDHLPGDWGEGWPNVWLGVSVENQKYAGLRIPLLVRVPVAVRFISAEPLLGPIDFAQIFGGDVSILSCDPNCSVHACGWPGCIGTDLHWVIVGGESGPGARSMDLRWVRSLIKQCEVASVACFVKQLGAKPYDSFYEAGATDQRIYLKDRKGGDVKEWPVDLNVREFPSVRAM